MANVDFRLSETSHRILVATPTYDRNVSHDYSASLAETCCVLRAKNIVINSSLLVSSSLLCKARNTIVAMFLESDATHLLCIDSDIGWPVEAVEAMIMVNKDIICGVYPARDPFDPVKNTYIFHPELDDKKIIVSDGPLIKALNVPAGFMLIKRNAIEKMVSKFPERYVESVSNGQSNFNKMHIFFNTEIHEGKFWGEDYTFCRLAREAGNEIWVDPYINFKHAGRSGRLVDSLNVNDKTQDQVEKLKLVSKQEIPAEENEITFNVKRG